MNEWMKAWTNEWLNKKCDGMNKWLNEQTRPNESKNEWMNRETNEWISKLLIQDEQLTEYIGEIELLK